MPISTPDIPQDVLYVTYKDRECTFHTPDERHDVTYRLSLNRALSILLERSDSYITLGKTMIVDMLAVTYFDMTDVMTDVSDREDKKPKKILYLQTPYNFVPLKLMVGEDALSTFVKKRKEFLKSSKDFKQYYKYAYTSKGYILIERKTHELCFRYSDILLVVKEEGTDYCKVFTLSANNEQTQGVYRVLVNLEVIDQLLNALSVKRYRYDRNSLHIILNTRRIHSLDTDPSIVYLKNGRGQLIKVELFGQERNRYRDMFDVPVPKHFFEMKVTRRPRYTILSDEQAAIIDIIEANKQRAARDPDHPSENEVEFATF